MYTVNKTRSRKKLFLRFFIALVIIFTLIFLAVWFFVIRNDDSSSANFSRTGGTVAVVKPTTKDFVTKEFKLTLPSGWELLGKENPFGDEEYYYFQSKVEDYTNRWLKVFVDVYPKDYALSRLLPITVSGNKVTPGIVSNDCRKFDGAPKPGAQDAVETWTAEWEGISFICNMANPQNQTGTSSEEQGYGVTVVGKSGASHKYFFVYIDHNIRPDYNILIDAVESFEAL